MDFYADWCPPCKAMDPLLERLGNEYPDLCIKKVNVEDDRKLAEKYSVQAMPTYILACEGEELRRITGAMSYDALVEFSIT